MNNVTLPVALVVPFILRVFEQLQTSCVPDLGIAIKAIQPDVLEKKIKANGIQAV